MSTVTQPLSGSVTTPQRRESAAGRIVIGIVIGLLLTLGLVIATLPFVWGLMSALAGVDSTRLRGDPILFVITPTNWSLDSFAEAWFLAGVSRYVLNTVIYAVASTSLAVFTASLAGYSFARLRYPGRNLLFYLFLSTMMIPGSVTLIPLFVLMLRFPLVGGNDLLGQGGSGFFNTMPGLILPNMIAVSTVFLFRQFFLTLPSELEDAARIDGCSEVGIWWRIILPLSGPVLATTALFNFQGDWNAYLWPLIMSASQDLYTIQIGIAALAPSTGGGVARDVSSWTDILLAGSAIAIIPIVIIFILGQRYFVKGIALTGLK